MWIELPPLSQYCYHDVLSNYTLVNRTCSDQNDILGYIRIYVTRNINAFFVICHTLIDQLQNAICSDIEVTCSTFASQWRHIEHDGVSNHQPHGCLRNRLYRRRSKKTSKLRVTGLCEGNSPATGEFPTQMASNVGNVSIWWRHHGRLPVLHKLYIVLFWQDV